MLTRGCPVALPLTWLADIYTNIFAQPTAVQRGLTKPGKDRTNEDLLSIAHMLRSLDFFRNMRPRLQTKFCKVRGAGVWRCYCGAAIATRCALSADAGSCMRPCAPPRVASTSFAFPFARWHCARQLLRYRKYASGEYICRQGDEQGDFFILMSGVLLVKINVGGGGLDTSEISINTIEPGQFFGQLSLLFNTRRGVSVVSKGSSELLSLTRRACDKLGLRDVFVDDMEAKAAVFRRSGAFVRFEDERLRFLAALAQPMSVPPGTVLIKQGQQPTQLFILKRGICVVEKTHDVLADVEVRIAEIQHELELLGTYYVYHRDMRRKRRVSFHEADDEDEDDTFSAIASRGRGSPTTVTSKQRSPGAGRGGGKAGGAGGTGAAPERAGRKAKDKGGDEEFTTQGLSKRAALRKELREMMSKREKVLEARAAVQKYVACVSGRAGVVHACACARRSVLSSCSRPPLSRGLPVQNRDRERAAGGS